MAKAFERVEARRLREEMHWPITRIAEHLGVAKSSVSTWVRDIPVPDEQRRQLRTRGGANHGTRRFQAEMLDKRTQWQLEGRAAARRAEPLHVAGVMLYWAEGTKRGNRNSVLITNGDPALLKLFVRFLRKHFTLAIEDIRLSCTYHTANGFSEENVGNYWLSELELPVSCLTGFRVDVRPRSSNSKGIGKLPHGMCRIAVHRTDIIQHIYGAIQEYGGFANSHWVQ